MHLVERIASGIPRMREAMIKAGLPEPKFETTGFFTAIFPRQTGDDGVNDIVNPSDGIVNDIVNHNGDIKEAVLQLITNNEGLSASDIANRIGKSWRTAMRYLDSLKKEDKIEFRGAPKTGGYYLK
jgi:ATP-dependent DNA helicase RecG